MTDVDNKICELSMNSLDGISGGRVSLANTPGYRGPKPKTGGSVGEGDTIDGIPWGGQPGDGSWQTVNGNLPGAGPWGN